MRPGGTQLQLEVRRRVGVALLEAGWGIHQVGASPGSVCRWRDTLAYQGEAGLTAKRHSGSKPRLTGVQREQLMALLSQGTRAHGFRNALWTLSRIAALIERHFGRPYSPSGV